jgi:hypothetical protein
VDLLTETALYEYAAFKFQDWGSGFVLQFGLAFEGLATTRPAEAPSTNDPLAPRLFRVPWSAIGRSVAMNASTSTVVAVGSTAGLAAQSAAQADMDMANLGAGR